MPSDAPSVPRRWRAQSHEIVGLQPRCIHGDGAELRHPVFQSQTFANCTRRGHAAQRSNVARYRCRWFAHRDAPGKSSALFRIIPLSIDVKARARPFRAIERTKIG